MTLSRFGWMASASLSALLLVTGCSNTLDRLEQVGKPPAMATVQNPQTKPDYKPVSWPLPEATPPGRKHANSLWQPGARSFYRDQRANRVGDILRVNIKIRDKAELDNNTTRTRTSTENLGAPEVLGVQNNLVGFLPGKVNPTNWLSIEGEAETEGEGTIKREEVIETQVAAIVTQVLPNGNLVIDGKQEVRVNFELREVFVQGVIRPEDIRSDNTIDSTQIAEARISYGGRGQITDVQQPRWGTQVIDALAPF